MLLNTLAIFFICCASCCHGRQDEQLSTLMLEEKVGQLLMVHFRGEAANAEAKVLIQKAYVGGIIYYNWSNGLTSARQVQALSRGLQEMAAANRTPLPLLIAADQEGGVVARLTQGFTIFPGNKALAMTADPELASQCALAMAEEMQAVGVNMNLAPVVDINSNPRNPIIGIRSFGETPEIVCLYGEKSLQGYHEGGIITTLKHFPGHGDVEIDSHEDLPFVNKSLAELEKSELVPFSRLAGHADTMMTAHIVVNALDPDNCTTLSRKSLDFLRDKIGYQGVVITDSLVMEGVLKSCPSVEEAAIRAFNAGCDILLLGGKALIGSAAHLELAADDVLRIHKCLVAAVKSGRISEARLNQAVERILTLKARYRLDQFSAHADSGVEGVVNTPAHRRLAEKIASLALRYGPKANAAQMQPPEALHQKRLLVIAPEIMHAEINHTSLLQLGQITSSLFFKELNPSLKEMAEANAQANHADVIIFCSYNAWKNPDQAALIASLVKAGKPVIMMVLRDSLDAALFPDIQLCMTTFSPTYPSIQAACDQLTKEKP